MGNEGSEKCKGGRGMDNGAIYGLGMIGAAVYFVQHSTGFWSGVLGLLKAVVWPAVVVHKVLGLLGL